LGLQVIHCDCSWKTLFCYQTHVHFCYQLHFLELGCCLWSL
jgi:hypothetical protein